MVLAALGKYFTIYNDIKKKLKEQKQTFSLVNKHPKLFLLFFKTGCLPVVSYRWTVLNRLFCRQMYFIFKDDLILNGQINSEGYFFNSMSEYYFVYKVHATCPPLEILPFLCDNNSAPSCTSSLLWVPQNSSTPPSFLLHFLPFLPLFFFPSGSRVGEEKQTHLEPREKGMNLAC